MGWQGPSLPHFPGEIRAGPSSSRANQSTCCMSSERAKNGQCLCSHQTTHTFCIRIGTLRERDPLLRADLLLSGRKPNKQSFITSIENPECSHVLYFLDSKHQSFITDIGFCHFSFFGARFRPVNQDLGSLFMRAVAVTSRKDSGKVAGSGGTHAAPSACGLAATMPGHSNGIEASKLRAD